MESEADPRPHGLPPSDCEILGADTRTTAKFHALLLPRRKGEEKKKEKGRGPGHSIPHRDGTDQSEHAKCHDHACTQNGGHEQSQKPRIGF